MHGDTMQNAVKITNESVPSLANLKAISIGTSNITVHNSIVLRIVLSYSSARNQFRSLLLFDTVSTMCGHSRG